MRHLLSVAIALLSITAVTAVPLVAAAPGQTINGVPMCDGQNGRPAHDPTQWHPLVARDASGNVICTYGHEHGMDPSSVDSVLGPLARAHERSSCRLEPTSDQWRPYYPVYVVTTTFSTDNVESRPRRRKASSS